MKPFPRVTTASPEDIAKAESPSTKMLLALAATGKHVYAGTIFGAEKATRRKKGKAQRAARKVHR